MAARDSWSKTPGSNSSLMRPYRCQGNSAVDRKDTERAEAAVCRSISARSPKFEIGVSRTWSGRINGIEVSKQNCLLGFETFVCG